MRLTNTKSKYNVLSKFNGKYYDDFDVHILQSDAWIPHTESINVTMVLHLAWWGRGFPHPKQCKPIYSNVIISFIMISFSIQTLFEIMEMCAKLKKTKSIYILNVKNCRTVQRIMVFTWSNARIT